MNTACVPTIWLSGVTSGGYPSSFLTLGTSFNTSSYLLSAPCCFNWDNKLDNIPPGTWYFKVWGSVNNTLGSSIFSSMYLSLIGLKYSATSNNASIFNSGFLSISDILTTIDSVGGWEVPPLSGDIAVSIISTPASTAFI